MKTKTNVTLFAGATRVQEIVCTAHNNKNQSTNIFPNKSRRSLRRSVGYRAVGASRRADRPRATAHLRQCRCVVRTNKRTNGTIQSRGQTFRAVIGTANGVDERRRRVLWQEEFAIVKVHVRAKVLRREHFADGRNLYIFIPRFMDLR